MAIDYKKELESASKGMILVHKPDALIGMIVRTIVHKVKVRHAGILLHDKERDTYVLTVSRGAAGLKIPAGYARMDKDNPLIRFFSEQKNRALFSGGIVFEKAERLLKSSKLNASAKRLLKKLLFQMEIFEAAACIPSYFRDELMGILFLGEKNSGKRFKQEELDFFSALTSDVAMAIRNARLFEDLELEISKKHRLFIHTTIALAAAIDAKDHYTHGHTSRVTSISLEIARKLAEKAHNRFNEKFMENLHIAGLLHDIGKIGIPESILNKQGSLTAKETEMMHEHPAIGSTILLPIKELEEPLKGVKYHHERYDGSGYPEGLKGEDIPLIAAVIAVADSFDAMTTDRPYRRGLTKEKAVIEIEKNSGTQFNPLVVQAFSELYKEGKL